MVSVVHCVVCVSELAVCSSSLVAMVGRMEERPLVKNGDANISSALSKYSSQVSLARDRQDESERDHGADQIARDHDALAIQRSSRTPAMGPAITAGIARESMIPVTTSPERVFASARLKTATLLK